MDNLRVLQKESDVKTTLQEMLDRADNFEGVIVVALNKDSSQFLQSSTMNGMQKSFLVGFMNAWLTKWFRVEND